MRLKLILLVLLSFFSVTGAISPQNALSAQNQNPNLNTKWKIFKLSLEDQAKIGVQTEILAALILETKKRLVYIFTQSGKNGTTYNIKSDPHAG